MSNKFSSKLLRARLDYDMEEPGGKRRLGFTVHTGVEGVPDWEVELDSQGGPVELVLTDGQHRTQRESLRDLAGAEARVRDAVQGLREDILHYHPELKPRIEVLMVRIHKQVQDGFREAQEALSEDFPA
jgi:hypothetical protein